MDIEFACKINNFNENNIYYSFFRRRIMIIFYMVLFYNSMALMASILFS